MLTPNGSVRNEDCAFWIFGIKRAYLHKMRIVRATMAQRASQQNARALLLINHIVRQAGIITRFVFKNRHNIRYENWTIGKMLFVDM